MKKGVNGRRVFLKYFYSYMFILCSSLVILFFIIEGSVRSKINEEYKITLQSNVDNITEKIYKDFLTIYHLYYNIKEDSFINERRYKSDSYRTYDINRELSKYMKSSSVITDIVYVDKYNNDIYSATYDYSYDAAYDDLYMQYSADKNIKIHLNNNEEEYVQYINTEGARILLFSPEQISANCYIYFILNLEDIESIFEGAADKTTVRISCYDKNDKLIYDLYHNKDVKEVDEDETVILESKCSYPNMTLRYYYVGNVYSQKINQIFSVAYIILIVMVIIETVVVYFITMYVYKPLKEFALYLSQNDPDTTGDMNDYFDINNAQKVFDSIKKENEHLLVKMTNYQVNMHKSLLQTYLRHKDCTSLNNEEIDKLFMSNTNCYIAMYVHGEDENTYAKIKKQFEEWLGHQIMIFTMENEKIYLVLLPKKDIDTCEITKEIIQDKMNTLKKITYISELTDNPMDIPRLYENVIYKNNDENIYLLLDDFEAQIADQAYEEGLKTMQKIFEELDKYDYQYLSQSVLLTLLNYIVHSFIEFNTPFSYYSNEYYEALYLARSRNYLEVKGQVKNAYESLFNILSLQISTEKLTEENFERFIKKEFCNSSLSINFLGEHFKVSGTYISYWFKRKYNKNLSDYFWELRFDKAIELMKDEKNSMTDISSMVGYDNYSSFRRKFKMYCGVSPSEYRQEHFGI